MADKVSFLAFFLMWAKRRRWNVPDIHIRACHWLEHRGDLAVLRCFRGFGKSTILAVYNAWCFYCDPQYRILHQGADDKTAYKTSRDTQNVLRGHPLTRGMFRSGGVESWWVEGADDVRNASFYAKGILSNVTSSRANECQNDDVEVPKNIKTPENREKLRDRLSEQTHISLPEAKQLFIGTPHTHDSIYDEQEEMGADCLTIRLFEGEYRIDDAKRAAYELPFVPVYVFAGIGKYSRLLVEDRDYKVQGKRLVFASAPGGLVDCYSECAWPERFNRKELEKRRRKTRTINGWDSQYQLHSKPIHEVRLDPNKLIPYDVEPTFRTQNKALTMWLGKVQIVSARAYWDCATGKKNSDDSVLSVLLDDARGNSYWHRAEAMTGEFAEFSDARNTEITGGQVLQAAKLIKSLKLGNVVVETNGVGTFVPKLLMRALRQEGITCGVTDKPAKGNKNERILSGIEGPLNSGVLWAHSSVVDGPAGEQMKDWNPDVADQPDDYLDSGAGALLEAPVRIGQSERNRTDAQDEDWRPSGGVYEATHEA